MTLYCDSSWQSALQNQQFSSFEQIWDYPVQWIDTPNQNRGGWSGVGCVEVLFENKPVTLFVKKQLNHTTRTWLHPFKGVPTFAKEFHMMRHLQSHGVATPNVIFFSQRTTKAGQHAILITERLAGYQPLDTISMATISLLQKRELLRCVARTIRHMHQLGIQHRALYAKHIFVKPNGLSFDIALIDLEKYRRMVFPSIQSIVDLITLNYRTPGWTKTSRLFFLKQYLQQTHLNLWGGLVVKWISSKTAHKHQQWNKKYE